MITTLPKDLWGLVNNHHHLDPRDLTAAIEEQIASRDLDYRTCVLIRDSVKALGNYWGPERMQGWLATSPAGDKIKAICNREFDDDRGFPSLMRRVMNVTRPDTIQRYLRDLASHVKRPLRLDIGGSVALILSGHLARHTEDIDVVDEVPPEIRSEHALLHHLKEVHGLELTHFQRHYLPMGWEQRAHTQPPIGRLQVSLLDVYDVFLSKLFSARTKDRQDLGMLAPQLDKEKLTRLMKETSQSMLAAPGLREKAEKNWFMLYGEPLPS